MTFIFPEGAVDSDFQLNITKIKFNCDLSLKTPEPKEEEINLLNILITIKKWLSGEKTWDYLRRLLNLWKN